MVGVHVEAGGEVEIMADEQVVGMEGEEKVVVETTVVGVMVDEEGVKKGEFLVENLAVVVEAVVKAKEERWEGQMAVKEDLESQFHKTQIVSYSM